MKKIGFAILGIITAAALTVPVIAEDGAGKTGDAKKGGDKMEAFKKADANNDGKLSLEEFKTMVTKGDAEKKFKEADADKDGFVTPEELKAAHAKHAKGDKPAKDAAK